MMDSRIQTKYGWFFLTIFLFCIPVWSESYRMSPGISPSLLIKEISYKDKISPRNGSIDFYISYTIRNDKGLRVYFDYINSKQAAGFELFLTESSMTQLSIPQFEWKGKSFQADKKFYDMGYNDTESVPDGTYFLSIDLLSAVPIMDTVLDLDDYIIKDEKGKKRTEFTELEIEVDSTPPHFKIECIAVPRMEYARTSDYDMYYLYASESNGAKIWKVRICAEPDGHVIWEKVIDNSASGKEKEFPVIPLSPSVFSGDCYITVYAEDNLGNTNKKTKLWDSRYETSWKFLSNAPVASDVRITRLRETYINELKKTIQPYFDNTVINTAGIRTLLQKNTIPHYQDFISELCIGVSKNMYVVPINTSVQNVSCQIETELLPQGIQPVFIRTSGSGTESSTVHVGTVTVQTRFPDVRFAVVEKNSGYQFSFVPNSLENAALSWKITIRDSVGKYEETVLSGRGFSYGQNGLCTWTQNDAVPPLSKLTARLTFENGIQYEKPLSRLFQTNVRFDGQEYLAVPDIIFPGSKDSFLEDGMLSSDGVAVIRNVAATLLDNSDIIKVITICGFANPESDVYDIESLNRENEKSLIPLSLQRAEYVKNLLVIAGIPEEKIKTKGMGGLDWEADPADKDNNWKNRRVQFVIQYAE